MLLSRQSSSHHQPVLDTCPLSQEGGAETEVALDPRERQHSRDPPVQTFHSRCGNGSPGREVNCSRPYNDFIMVFFLINPAINNKTVKIY